MNRDLEDLDSCLKGNKLSLNAVKTQALLSATKARHKVLNTTAEYLKLDILGSELDVALKPGILVFKLIAV